MLPRGDKEETFRGCRKPLYSREDVQAMIRNMGVTLKVAPDAERWLQARASTLGMGSWGMATISLYLAYKTATVKENVTITADHLEDIETLALGSEDAERVSEVVAEASGMRRVV